MGGRDPAAQPTWVLPKRSWVLVETVRAQVEMTEAVVGATAVAHHGIWTDMSAAKVDVQTHTLGGNLLWGRCCSGGHYRRKVGSVTLRLPSSRAPCLTHVLRPGKGPHSSISALLSRATARGVVGIPNLPPGPGHTRRPFPPAPLFSRSAYGSERSRRCEWPTVHPNGRQGRINGGELPSHSVVHPFVSVQRTQGGWALSGTMRT